LNRRGFRLLMIVDILVLNLVMYGTNFVRFGTQWPNSSAMFVASFAVASVITFVILYFGGLYEREPHLGSQGFAARVARLMLISGGGIALVTLASSGFFREFNVAGASGLPFPFVNLLVLIGLGTILLTVLRVVGRRMRRRREGRPQVLLVGEATDVAAAKEQFSGAPPEFDIVQAVTELGKITDALEANRVTDVLLLSPHWLEDGGQELVYQMDEKGVNVLLRVRGVDTMLGLKSLAQVSGLPFIQLRPSALPLSSAHFKRIIDLVLVLGTAPLWLPLFGLISLYQLIVAGRPIFFVQHRVGLGNKTFPMIKFRTMGLEAEKATGAVLSSADDDRVIPACKWVRATRMDELPQLFNVLVGHMSIVGPRPERPELIATFGNGIQGYERRHAIRPGLTGLAQIYGRYNTKPEYKLGYDLHYAVNWSALLDAEILLRTIAVVLLRRV
jgi:exopolysaccharide biosynthesis polyprenyl glycosylphosphotransferase